MQKWSNPKGGPLEQSLFEKSEPFCVGVLMKDVRNGVKRGYAESQLLRLDDRGGVGVNVKKLPLIYP